MSTPLRSFGTRVGLIALATLTAIGLAAGGPASAPATGAGTAIGAYVPPIHHVFVINIENKGYDATWGAGSAAPYLATTLRNKGVLLSSYYGTVHNSQGNYIGQVSGQGPNPDMQGDCQIYSDFVRTGTAPPGQAVGTVGCIFPKGVPTVMGQLDAHGLSWRGYMQNMGTPCRHPAVGSVDDTQKATPTQNYAVRHNPFMYFHDVIDRPAYCANHVQPLDQLTRDLASVSTTRNLTYITPDLCSDGHDAPCANGKPGGLAQVNTFMSLWVPRILNSPAYQRDGVLIITADESDSPQSDSSACCNETAVNTPNPGISRASDGTSGGGKIGALVLSRWTRGGSWATTPYNHYSLLGSIEDIFRLPRLGYASTVPDRFGRDVYNTAW